MVDDEILIWDGTSHGEKAYRYVWVRGSEVNIEATSGSSKIAYNHENIKI